MKLIAGIDPGKTVGIALIGISSDFIHVTSKRNSSISEVCAYISDKGEPIIIASDKKESPKSVEKIAAAFNAKLFSPRNDLSIQEKKELTKDFAFGNTHERDALAAAILAKRHFSTTFEKVDYTLEKNNMTHISDAVKELLIKNEVGNIEQAIKLLTGKTSEKEVKIIPKIIETKKVLELNEKLKMRERTIEILKSQFEELKKDNLGLKKELKIRSFSSNAENLRKSIASLKNEKQELLLQKDREINAKQLGKNHEIIYREVDFVNPEDMKDRVILLDNNNFSIAKFEPKAIISEKIPEKIKTDIPVIRKQQINIRKIDNFLVVDKKELEDAIKNSFLSWLKNYKERFDE